MTIVEVTAVAFGAGRHGGGERHPLGFATELARHESVVFACTGASGIDAGSTERLEVPALQRSFPPFVSRTNPLPTPTTLSAVGKFLRRHSADIEFVHVHNLRTAIGTSWIVLSHLRRSAGHARIILTDHGARFFPWPRLTANLVDYYAPVSAYSERMLQALARHPSCVVPTAVSEAFTSARPPPDWAIRDLDLLFVGRIVPWKRPERIVELAERLSKSLGRPVRAAIAGANADPELTAALQRRARASLPSAIVEFHTDPADRLLVELYGRARFLVFASDAIDSLGRRHPAPELSSVAVLEAASQGTPAIATALPAALENIQDGKTGLIVDGFDTSTSIDRVSAVLNDPAVGRAMSDRAREYVIAERTYPRTVARFRAFLDAIRRGAV